MFVTDFVAGDSRKIAGGWSLGFSNGTTLPTAKVNADFNGDGQTDLSVFHPINGVWYILRSSDNGFLSTQFGANGNIPIPSANLP